MGANELWAQYNGGSWELIDTADEDTPRDVMLAEYRMAFGRGWQFEWR